MAQAAAGMTWRRRWAVGKDLEECFSLSGPASAAWSPFVGWSWQATTATKVKTPQDESLGGPLGGHEGRS